jgi:hypothetical protein
VPQEESPGDLAGDTVPEVVRWPDRKVSLLPPEGRGRIFYSQMHRSSWMVLTVG